MQKAVGGIGQPRDLSSTQLGVIAPLLNEPAAIRGIDAAMQAGGNGDNSQER
jgi:hypothetical protein